MGARKLKLQGRASEMRGTTKKPAACTSEGYGILKAKKEALAAVRLMRFHRVPGGHDHDLWMDEWREMKAKAAEEAARPVRKRKRVVKERLPKALIDLMVARPFRSVEDYEQALVHQYNAQGYAEDETEVTDSEEEEEEDATVVERGPEI